MDPRDVAARAEKSCGAAARRVRQSWIVRVKIEATWAGSARVNRGELFAEIA